MPIEEPVEEHNPTEQMAENDRRKRVTNPHIWLKDYVITKRGYVKCSYSMANYVGYDHLSADYQEYLIMFSTPTEPRNFKEASKD